MAEVPIISSSPNQSFKAPNKTTQVIGQKVPLEDVNWKDHEKTLVLYLSATCRYCTESIPFYQRLIRENAAKGIEFIAVMPQEDNEAKAYLNSKKLEITQTYKASFASIGVTSTPTLLLVDNNGVVTDSWRGKLAPDRENEVIDKLSS